MVFALLLHLADFFGVVIAPLAHTFPLALAEHGGGFFPAAAVAADVPHLLELIVGYAELLPHVLLVRPVALLAIFVRLGCDETGNDADGAGK
jgi:hypothetical protein